VVELVETRYVRRIEIPPRWSLKRVSFRGPAEFVNLGGLKLSKKPAEPSSRHRRRTASTEIV